MGVGTHQQTINLEDILGANSLNKIQTWVDVQCTLIC